MKKTCSLSVRLLLVSFLVLSGLVVSTSLVFCAGRSTHMKTPDAVSVLTPHAATSSGDPSLGSLKTFSVSGKNIDILEANKEVEICRHTGKGCLTYMYFAMDERVRVRVYVDGEQKPSIDMALDLGHGYGFGGTPAPFGSPRMGRYGAQFNTYHIPYGKSVRVTLFPITDKFDAGTHRKGWWTIQGTDNLPLTVAGVRLPDRARLKLYTLEPYEAKPLEEFDMCNVKGAGLLYLVVMAVHGERKSGSWTDLSFMEGEIRAYMNGNTEPELLSSGLEDYFLGSGYFHQSQVYYGATAGLTYINKDENAFSAYRFHDDDPVFFQNGLRLTCRDGEPGIGNPPPTQYRTYVWLYQW